MPPQLTLDPATIDLTNIFADKEAIRAINRQRFEMEQLDAVVLMDTDTQMIAGYKDIDGDEFWARGHLPNYPIFPGVLMCEAAAQLCSFYVTYNKLLACDFLGFGGLDNVRFRGAVYPGDRFVMVGKLTKCHRRQIVSSTQGFVNNTMVFQADIIGVPMHTKVPFPIEG